MLNLSPNLVSYFRKYLFSILLLSFYSLAHGQSLGESKVQKSVNLQQLASELKVGDVVFIHVSVLPFEKISSTTESWANHVGIVVDVSSDDPIIGESRVPFSGTTTLSRFVGRSKDGQVEVKRLNKPLNNQQENRVLLAAEKRALVFYDTGFNLHSNRQFCSRYVREVLNEATGTNVGEVVNFTTLFKNNPNTDLKFWKIWYFGNIPWERETVSPASLLHSEKMHTLFYGNV
jgi:hydrogenase maturation factor